MKKTSMSSMKNIAEDMKKNIMKRLHVVPHIYHVGMLLMIFFLHLMMNPFGRNLLVLVVKLFNGKNSHKYSEYFMEYCALKEDIREVLYFQYFYSLEIQKPFRDPHRGENIKNIAHMVDEMC